MFIKYGTVQKDVPRETFAAEFVNFCNEGLGKKCGSLFLEPRPKDQGDPGWYSGLDFVRSTTPTDFQVHIHGDWIVLKVAITFEPDWLFFHRADGHVSFQLVTIPQGCTVEKDASMTCQVMGLETGWGHMIYVNSGLVTGNRDDRWPRVILNPRAWVALDVLKKIAESGQTKNLAMLSQSNHQPCRGVAIQLKGEIVEAIRVLTVALS